MIKGFCLFLIRVYRRIYWYFLQAKGFVVFGRYVGIVGDFQWQSLKM